jgi:hypothetical protein
MQLCIKVWFCIAMGQTVCRIIRIRYSNLCQSALDIELSLPT